MSITKQIKICDEDDNGGKEIRLSSLVSNLLMGVLAVLGTTALAVGVLSWRAMATEGDVENLQDRQTVVERNQVILDGNQRRLMRNSDWTQSKLNALLLKAGVTEIPVQPPLPDSAIKSPPQ